MVCFFNTGTQEDEITGRMARSHRDADIQCLLGPANCRDLKKDSFAKAIGDFSVAYADQAEQDYEALVKAVKSGKIAAETGV